MKTLFEQIGGTYTQVGDYWLPDLAVEESGPISKYGRMRKRYLKEQRPVLFTELIVSGRLYQHLSEVDLSCAERMELLIQQMKRREGVTESLKVTDQMEWIRRMNNIHSRAEEIVLSELVFE